MSEASADRQPFDGLKVLEFCWGAVGPFTSRYLADHGATVLRVESATRPDFLRTYVLTRDPNILETNTFFALANANKRSMSLNMKKPAAVAIARRLVAEWADVVVENFAPGALERMGLGYNDLRQLKPDLIMLSTSILGQTGPWRGYSGFGSQGSAYSGFTHFCGWPDAEPVGTAGTITDSMGPRFCGFALVAALDYRRRTGQGCYLDVSQTEAAMVALAPSLIDYQVNLRELQRLGNQQADYAPRGVFPCAGQERWIAIACRADSEWNELVDVMGRPAWSTSSTLSTITGRLAHQDELEAQIAAWTATQNVTSLLAKLQAAGVPAGLAAAAEDILADPQLDERRAFWRTNHAYLGDYAVVSAQHRLENSPPVERAAGPLLGEANGWALLELLQIDRATYDLYAAEGVLD